MKGDYSKIPFDERKKMQHYRKVYLQQGKVLLDSDLNENTDLLHYQMKTLAKDGLCGSPNIGFRIGRGVPLLPVDDHRYIGEGKGWSITPKTATATIDYFKKFEGKGSLKLQNATEVVFSLQNSSVDLSRYRYIRLAIVKNSSGDEEGVIRLFVENLESFIDPEESTELNGFSILKYSLSKVDAKVNLKTITRIGLKELNSGATYYIGAVECSPPMFILDQMTQLKGWNFVPADNPITSISDIDGRGMIVNNITKLSKIFFSPIDLSKYETLEFTIQCDQHEEDKASDYEIKFCVNYVEGMENKTFTATFTGKKGMLNKHLIKNLPQNSLTSVMEYGFDDLLKTDTYHFGSILYGMSLNNNFVISGTDPLSGETGRLYVDGELYEKEEAETYLNQKDCPLVPSTDIKGKDLVYVDVWQRHVTSAEDPELREVAVGVDTCNRMKAVAQVKVLKGKTSLPSDLKPTGGGRLSTSVEYMEAEKLCKITPGVEYTGLENRLYRVEIHTLGEVGSAAYKWSRNNASTVSQIIENVKKDTASVKVKDVKLFEIGDIIEIADDRVEFADNINNESSIKPWWGELRRITSIDRNELSWDATASDNPLSMAGGLPHDYTAEGVETTHPRAIKWDGANITSKEETLEDGIKIKFSGSDMLPGDYWTFTARENTRAVERLDNEPPQGVVHCYYPLAVIEWGENGEIINVTDLRTRFEPLCGLTAADLAFDNANTPIWTDAENVQQALERITFPKASGIQFDSSKCNFLYGNMNNVQDALNNLCNGITVPSLTLKGKDLEQSKWPKLKCSDSGDISFLTGAGALEERVRISADGMVGIEKGLQIKGNVGIGTTSHEIYKLDVHGYNMLTDPESNYNSHFPFKNNCAYITGSKVYIRGGKPDGWKKCLTVDGASGWTRIGDGSSTNNIQFEPQSGFHRVAFNELRFWDWDTKEDMVIFKDGNVGIGTTPHEIYKLDVHGYNMLTDPESNYNSHFPFKNNCAYITGSKVYIRGGKPDGWKKCLTVDGASGWTRIGDGSSTNNIQFEPQSGFHRVAFNELRFWDWDTKEDMVTFKDGNVGIGTTNPQDNKLYVNGTIRSTNLIVDEEIKGKIWYSKEYSWKQGGKKKKMIHKDKGFCFLTSVSGKFEGGGEYVKVCIEGDYWYLGGISHQVGLSATARCVGMP